MKNLKLKEKLNSSNFFVQDKISLLLGILTTICMVIAIIFSISSGKNVEVYAYETQNEDYVNLNNNLNKSYANYVDSSKNYILEIEDSLNFDFYSMKKSDIQEKIDNLNTILKCMENLNLGNSYFYENINDKLRECYDVLTNQTYLYPYTYDDYNLLAYVIMREAGDSSLPDEQRDLVGLVVINRLNNNGINRDLVSPTIADIINEPGQYPYKSSDINISNIPDYCYESAKRVLEHEVSCPANVVYQGNTLQGSGVYSKFYSEIYGWTYFCYL